MSIFTFWKKKAALVNSASTPRDEILRQMNEPRPLPMGQKEFMEWSSRIISGALVPTEDTDSLRAILSAMVLGLGDTESHKPDAYFIHKLRKAAANEVANANFQEIKKRKSEAAQAEKPKISGVVNLNST